MIRAVHIQLERRVGEMQSRRDADEEEAKVLALLAAAVIPRNVPVHVVDRLGAYLYTPQGKEGQDGPSDDCAGCGGTGRNDAGDDICTDCFLPEK